MKANRTAKYLAVCAAAALTASCGSSAITGEWTEPVPGMDNMVQGIRIDKGGKASSVNMSTLKYEKWHKAGRSLVLSGKSIGNGQTIAFTDTFAIDKLTSDSLILTKGSYTIRYKRNK